METEFNYQIKEQLIQLVEYLRQVEKADGTGLQLLQLMVQNGTIPLHICVAIQDAIANPTIPYEIELT